MSRTTAIRLLGPCLVAVLTLGGLTSVTPSAAADDTTPCVDSATPGTAYTAPAPVKTDASGVARDQFFIPGDFSHPVSSWGGYFLETPAGRQSLTPNTWHSTQGASTVVITTSYDSGSWTFCFSSEQTGVEAPHGFELEKGVCSPKGRRTPLSVLVTNTDDDTNLPLDKVTVVPGPAPEWGITTDSPIQDGEVRRLTPGKYDAGFLPGFWTLRVYLNNDTEPIRTFSVTLKCNKSGEGSGNPGNKPVLKPRASIKQVALPRPRCGRSLKVKLSLMNRASTGAVTLRMVKNPTRGKTISKIYKLKAGKNRKQLVGGVRPGTRVKVMWKGKILARMTVRTPRGC